MDASRNCGVSISPSAACHPSQCAPPAPFWASHSHASTCRWRWRLRWCCCEPPGLGQTCWGHTGEFRSCSWALETLVNVKMLGLPGMWRVHWRRQVVLSVFLWVAEHVFRNSGIEGIIRGWRSLLSTLLGPLSARRHSTDIIAVRELWITAWSAHGQTGFKSISFQRKLHEPFTQRASVLSLQIPLSLTLTPLHVTDLLCCLLPLWVQVLGVCFGLLVGWQLLPVELVQVTQGALGVQTVPLVLLALRLLPHWHLHVLGLLLTQALQRGAGAACAPATTAASSSQRLLLDGQKRTSVSQVSVSQLFLNETVQHRSRGGFRRSHVCQLETRLKRKTDEEKRLPNHSSEETRRSKNHL